MDKDQGLQVIEQALQIANSKGVFKLEESATILTALTVVKNALQSPTQEIEGIGTKAKSAK
jgi:hypothetical protein